ncbi:MAG: ABC transporter substrate-binding protein [Clostridia bacterium]|jgi:iron complex transport system substrate-binding protein|nr:ABC transporter substrate-binding protein [Clostridia bacterium]MDD4571016.1 ABC transporter substrate-binding protein [Clostridia bacterium]
MCKKITSIILSVMLVLSLGIILSGCDSKNNDAQTATPNKAVAAIDAEGREVTFPENIDKIAITCNGGTTHEVAIFGGADMIVAQPSMEKFPQLLKMYPQFKNVVNAGSFDDVNVEQLMQQEPDIVLVGVSSKKGNKFIEDAGLPTYTMLIGWAAIDTLKQEFLNVGRMLNNESQAQALVKHWDDTLAELDEALAKIPENERKKVYYTGKVITKANAGDWGRTWIDGAGGIFAVPENVNGDISVEQVLEWNPDVIITQGGNGTADLLGDDRIQDIKAIKNKAVYECPIGGFWWDRPSPEATLGFLWLAKTLYPEYTQDINLEKETKDFYKEFYKYDLSNEEYTSFFFQ